MIIGNFGFMANILKILVCCRKELQKNTMGFYNIYMSVNNILAMIFISYLTLFPQSIGQEQLINTSYINCIMISYFLRVFLASSSWLNVMVTLDRMLCVTYLNEFKFIKDKKKLSLIIAGIFIVLCLINAPNFVFKLETQTEFDMFTNQTITRKVCISSKLISTIRDGLAVSMRIIIPLILQAVMNSILIYKLFKTRHNINMPRSLRKEYKFAFTVIILNIVDFVSDMPFLISTIFINIYGYSQSYVTTTSNEAAIASLAYISSGVLSMFMYVLLFFVNLIFNKVFRKEVRKIFNEKMRKVTMRTTTNAT